MRTSILVPLAVIVSCLAPSAGALEPAYRSVEELKGGTSEAVLFSQAIRVVVLPDGSRFVIRSVPARSEKNAIGASLLSTRGDARALYAANWIRPGISAATQMPFPGSLGQIYSGARFPDGRTTVVSVGWADSQGRSHNGIAVLDGIALLRNLIEVPGTVRDLAVGPGNTLLAVTYLTSRLQGDGGTPLLTVLDTNGVVHGEFFPSTASADLLVPAVGHARLQGLGKNRFAFYDDLTSTVRLFQLQVPEKTAGQVSTPSVKAFPVQAWFLATPDATAMLETTLTLPVSPGVLHSERPPILQSVHISPDDSVNITREIVSGGRPQTLITRYAKSGAIVGSWSPSNPWRAAFWDGEFLTGIVNQGDLTVLETVSFGSTP